MKNFPIVGGELLDYTVNLTAELAAVTNGDTIDTATWTIPAGFTLSSQSMTNFVATGWIEVSAVNGAAVGSISYVEVKITTINGRVYIRAFRLRVVRYKGG